MSDETQKSSIRRAAQSFFTNRVFVGNGIDIGSGGCPLTKEMGFPLIESCEPFDMEHGDAQFIHEYRETGKYDFVHSSNCLEHMYNPYTSLVNWCSLLKPGGYLVATFPEEDLYEQGIFPSRWNSDHKWTFSLSKLLSWSSRHVNVIDLVKKVPNTRIMRLDVIDTNYNYDLVNVDQTRGEAEAFVEIVLQKTKNYNFNSK